MLGLRYVATEKSPDFLLVKQRAPSAPFKKGVEQGFRVACHAPAQRWLNAVSRAACKARCCGPSNIVWLGGFSVPNNATPFAPVGSIGRQNTIPATP